MKTDQTEKPDDIVAHYLKKQWFELAKAENYPHTPEVSAELDRLRAAIVELNPK